MPISGSPTRRRASLPRLLVIRSPYREPGDLWLVPCGFSGLIQVKLKAKLRHNTSFHYLVLSAQTQISAKDADKSGRRLLQYQTADRIGGAPTTKVRRRRLNECRELSLGLACGGPRQFVYEVVSAVASGARGASREADRDRSCRFAGQHSQQSGARQVHSRVRNSVSRRDGRTNSAARRE